MVKIKDMEQMFDLENETEQEPTIEPETVEEAEDIMDEQMINAMFGLEPEPKMEEEEPMEEEIGNNKIQENNIGQVEGEEEMTNEENPVQDEEEVKKEPSEENIQKETSSEEQAPVESLVEELLNEAEKIGGEEVDQAAQEVQDAIDNGANNDEIMQKLAELETALANETLNNESLTREKEQLMAKISDLQDKLAEYEMRNYEYGTVEKAMDEDPSLKGFIKLLSYYKLNPEKIGKDRLISALDNLTQQEFGVSIKSLLEQKAKEENKKMTMGEEKQPIEITVSTDTENPMDEMFNV